VAAGAGVQHPSAVAQSPQQIDFNRDIRPIFNSQCITCHGGVKQASGVSFSYREQALGKGKSGRPIVVPGSPRASELLARVSSNDPDYRMPFQRPPLSSQQIALLRQWIEEGAVWENYWAFVPPKEKALPPVKQFSWVRQPLDRFILARLENERLAPSPEADKTELLRRVSLDLTGLPPTPDEQASFVADTLPDAYEKQVDRLLASPRFGERWASMWLDLARYADSMGFDKDLGRPGAWPYRDWVIDAYNANLPYDQFVIKQLAGDLLPNATFSDRIATGFHRNTVANDEAGTDDEEFRLAAVMDRNATTWSVLNGLTMNCVQCHSHPYDPIRHTEYYRSLAFFNTSRDADIASDKTLVNDWPVLRVPTDKSNYSEADKNQQEIARLRNLIVNDVRSREAADLHWQLMPIKQGSVNEILAIERALAELESQKKNKTTEKAVPNKNAKAGTGRFSKALTNKLQAAKGQDADGGGGPAKKLEDRLAIAKLEKFPPANFHFHDGMAETSGTVPANSVFEFSAAPSVSVMTALRIEVPTANALYAAHSPEKGFVANRIDAWVVQPDGAEQKIDFRFLAPDSIVNLESNFVRVLKNSAGSRTNLVQRLAEHSGFMANPNLFYSAWVVAIPAKPVQFGRDTHLKLQLTQTEVINQSSPAPRIRLSASSKSGWTTYANDPTLEKNLASLEQLERDLRNLSTVPLPVMGEEASYERRTTLEFDRGSFLTPVGPELAPDVPAVFPKLPANTPRNRLALARWFFAPGQPLTARVAVNRYWEQLFGTGIVETLEDFGSAGELPSHPELLDWLALHFQNDLHWNTKALLREIVTSATYRQRAQTTPELQQKDPRNRLLARGPQQRLTAEMVRDQALQASGLLNATMGGPPVMPEQPDDVWADVAFSTDRWVTSSGSDRNRRAVYTYIKRTASYPSLVTFDMADRQVSTPRRIPTDTPLQALVTLNDPVYEQAAVALARRMMRAPRIEKGDPLDSRLNFGARCVLSRDLKPRELSIMRRLYGRSGNAMTGLTQVASVMLNLDAALTR
jgi:hypothetical protein